MCDKSATTGRPQFSLGTLLVEVLAVGLWITAFTIVADLSRGDLRVVPAFLPASYLVLRIVFYGRQHALAASAIVAPFVAVLGYFVIEQAIDWL